MVKHSTQTGRVVMTGEDGKKHTVIERNAPFLTPEQIKGELARQEKTSENYVRTVLMPKALEIASTATREGCRGLNLHTDFVATPVRYMDSGIWELGFVPKKVDWDGARFQSNDVYLYRAGSNRLRGPEACTVVGNHWERWPD